jgi:hypothetical protein
MPDLLDFVEKAIARLKAELPLAEVAASNYSGNQLILISKEQALAYADLASRTNQTLPIVGFHRDLARKKNLHFAFQELSRSRIVRTDRLGQASASSPVKTGGKNPRVVEDDQVIGPEQIHELPEFPIMSFPRGTLEVQHTRSGSVRKRGLGDQFIGEQVGKFRDQHFPIIVSPLVPVLHP